jgi:hypothetical protein
MAEQKPYFKGLAPKPVAPKPDVKAQVIKKVIETSKPDINPDGIVAKKVLNEGQRQQVRNRAPEVAKREVLKKQTVNVNVKTKYGTAVIPYKGYRALDPEQQRQLLQQMQAEVEANEDAKRKPEEQAKPTANRYEATPSVDVDAETKKNLGLIESTVLGTSNPIYRAADNYIQDSKKANDAGQGGFAQFAKSIGLGIADSVLRPASTFEGQVGNLYDPSATAEERLGAVGNAALYGASMLPTSRGLIAGAQAVGKQGVKKAAEVGLQTFAKEALPGFVNKAIKNPAGVPVVNDLNPSALIQKPQSFAEFRAGQNAGDVSGVVPETIVAVKPTNQFVFNDPELAAELLRRREAIAQTPDYDDVLIGMTTTSGNAGKASTIGANKIDNWIEAANKKLESAKSSRDPRKVAEYEFNVSLLEKRKQFLIQTADNAKNEPLHKSELDNFLQANGITARIEPSPSSNSIYTIYSKDGVDIIKSRVSDHMPPRGAVSDVDVYPNSKHERTGKTVPQLDLDALKKRLGFEPTPQSQPLPDLQPEGVSTSAPKAQGAAEPASGTVTPPKPHFTNGNEPGGFSQQPSQPSTPNNVQMGGDAKAVKNFATESGDDLVGFAKQITGNDSLPGVNREKLLKAGEDAIATGKVNPDAYIDDIINKGVGNGDESAVAASVIELRKIDNRQKELEKIGTPEAVKEWNDLQARREKYDQAGDLIGNAWHRMGIALQVALKQDMSLGALKSRAKMSNFGADVSSAVNDKLDKISKQYEDALKQIEKLKSSNADVMEKIKSAPVGRLSVNSRVKARSVAADYFQGKKLEATGGVGKNRQRGAVSYTITPEEIRAKSAIRKLAKEIALDGAETLDDVLNGIRKEIGVDVKDEQLLGFIYEPYTKYRIEADVARIKANQALSDVQRAAEYRAKSVSAKAWTVFEGVLNNLTRTMSLGADLSAPMIQGRKGITANTRGWVKAYKPMLQVATAKNSEVAALEHLAKIENSVLYPKAKAAGLEITTPGGKFTSQEENFIGNMSQVLEIAQNAKGATKAIKVLQPYLSTMVRSEGAFTTFMNDLRWSTFERFAKVAPNDPQYLKDVSAFINVIYGRGTGKMAEAAGQLNLGRGLLAPRYLVSQLQYQSGVPIFAAKTGLAKRKIATEYAKYIGAVSSLMYLARMNGWDAPTDTRHTDFGRISNGKVTIDIASKDVQFWKLMMQNLYGKVNQVGGYGEPTFENAAKVDAQFIQGKLAPLPKLGSEFIFGQFTDQGKRVPIGDIPARDQALRIAPIWVQDLVKDSDKWDDKSKQALFTILGILGQDNKPKPIKEGGEPIRYTRPGIYSKG